VMECMCVDGIFLYFDAAERDAAELISQACARSTQLLHRHWKLQTPADCRIYVMTSWQGFAFQSAPWPWKVMLSLTFPFWAPRAKAIWPVAGGWQQSYGRRHALGIKPPRLLQSGDSSIGDKIFLRDTDVQDRVRSVACHELTHAFTAELRLPAWLKEGAAMVAVDRFFGRPTVKPETLGMLGRMTDPTHSRSDRKLRVRDPDELVYTYVRGYWLVRYLEETRPGLLADLLSRRSTQSLLEARIAASYGKSPEAYRDGINQVLIAYFQGRAGSASAATYTAGTPPSLRE
jgi:hypothetical protein